MPNQYSSPPATTIDTSKAYTATIDTSAGSMTLELFAEEAPLTVNNFVFLAGDGFYEDCQFHRVIRDFMIQGGCPKGDGTGGPGYRFQDEPVTRKYVKGTLAMANAGPDTKRQPVLHRTRRRRGPAPQLHYLREAEKRRGSAGHAGHLSSRPQPRRRAVSPHGAAGDQQHHHRRDVAYTATQCSRRGQDSRISPSLYWLSCWSYILVSAWFSGVSCSRDSEIGLGKRGGRAFV